MLRAHLLDLKAQIIKKEKYSIFILLLQSMIEYWTQTNFLYIYIYIYWHISIIVAMTFVSETS